MAAYGRGDYREALAWAERLLVLEPANGQFVFWAACFQARAGDGRGALGRLQAASDAGMWWAPEELRADEDLEPVWRLEGFQALVNECRNRMVFARAVAEPVLRSLEPEGPRSGVVLLALHGRVSSTQEAVDAWGPATSTGAVVAALGSSQLVGTAAACWDDLDVARRELDWAQERLPSGRLVLAGFSQGGILAIAEALRARADAFVALAPSVGRVGMPTLEELRPLLGRPGLRGAIVIGAEDFRLDAARELAAAAEEAGMPLRFDVVDGLDHAYPPDLAERLPDLLAFVVP
jgi:dienelactone hydrolase